MHLQPNIAACRGCAKGSTLFRARLMALRKTQVVRLFGSIKPTRLKSWVFLFFFSYQVIWV